MRVRWKRKEGIDGRDDWLTSEGAPLIVIWPRKGREEGRAGRGRRNAEREGGGGGEWVWVQCHSVGRSGGEEGGGGRRDEGKE